jgi:hypothetical protein
MDTETNLVKITCDQCGLPIFNQRTDQDLTELFTDLGPHIESHLEASGHGDAVITVTVAP